MTLIDTGIDFAQRNRLVDAADPEAGLAARCAFEREVDIAARHRLLGHVDLKAGALGRNKTPLRLRVLRSRLFVPRLARALVPLIFEENQPKQALNRPLALVEYTLIAI